ncbi:4-hydroxythreonine-4-phosphate dehydrogenase PdxA [Chelatococcus sp. GCM10030263]|uniref:4-hydroxythreonine-4-phosphate dehydrogenase PdxA n=1 Tax=Chelatococcus sp. GCM10030263 TaxID=3273387 RepID=UPI00361A2F5E
MFRPRIAVTSGDPAGIGPEIMARAASALKPRIEAGEFALALVGSAATHKAAIEALGIADASVAVTADRAADRSVAIGFLDVDGAGTRVPVGRSTAEGGRIAYDAIARAVDMALEGAVDAICTGPISKEALNFAGHHYSGHTELLADLTGARDSVMLLAHGHMRVSHVTTHVALADVPGRVTPERIGRVVALTDEALQALGLERRRIAVAALNPHAGEGGLFGRQDIDVVEPTIRKLRERGFDVEGPVPGDTVFVKLHAKQFDAVVAMYHDQGHIPVKLLGFSVDEKTGRWEALSGVNVTLGLPIIRTSVDHGTAFDIAGRGIASETSLIEAIDLAIALAKARRGQPKKAAG